MAQPAEHSLALPMGPRAFCRVTGHVFMVGVAGDTVPAKYANVLDVGSHHGAMTDEAGAFVLSGLTPGRVVLMIASVGSPKLLDTLDIVAGESINRAYRVAVPRDYVIRDSLSALGQWPPPLDPDLLEHMRKAHDVRAFRLDPEHTAWNAGPDPRHLIPAWSIVYEAHRPARRDIGLLIDALRAAPYRFPGLHLLYDTGFSPDVDVRFTHDGVPIDVVISYHDHAISIWREGRWVQTGDFHDPRFTDFARRAFPRDSVTSSGPYRPSKN